MRQMAMCAAAVLMFAIVANAQQPADPMADVSPGAMLRADKFDELEAYYAHYFKSYNPKVVNSYQPLNAAFYKIDFSEDLLPHCNKWIVAKPNSYAALLVRAGFYREYAWTARGSGFINTVSDKGYEIFTQRLLIADAAITKAAEMNPNVPFHYYEMLQLDMALQRGKVESFSHFMKARQIDPSFYPAYRMYLFMNRPRWGGSTEFMKKFAHDYADSVPGSELPMLWVEYHDEMSNPMNEDAAWWSKPGNWDQVDAIFKKLIEAVPEPRKGALRCSYVRYASRAKKLDVLRNQLELIGPNWRGYSYEDTAYYLAYIKQAWPNANENEWLITRTTAELKNKPQKADLYFSRAIAERYNKQYDASLRDLVATLKLDPAKIDAWRCMAEVCDRTSQTQEAIKAADRYLLRKPDSENVIAIKGSNLRKLGQNDAQYKLYRDSLNLHPAMNRISWDYAYWLMKDNSYHEAVEVVDKAEPFLKPKENRLTAFALLEIRARAKMAMNNPEAVEEYGNLLTIEDTETEAEAALGKMYLIGGTWEPYKTRIKELIEKNCKAKDDKDHRWRLTVFGQGANNTVDILSIAELMVKTSPNDPKARQMLAYAYLVNNRPAEALKLYQELYQENTSGKDAMLGLARALCATGEYDAAYKLGNEFLAKHNTTATPEEKEVAANIVGYSMQAKKENERRQTGDMSRPAPGSMSLSTPEMRNLAQDKKTDEALVIAVNHMESDPGSLDAYSDFLYFARLPTRTHVSSLLQIEHVIGLAEKRNAPPADPIDTQVYEYNKKNCVTVIALYADRDPAKDQNATLNTAAGRYATARGLLLAKSPDPARAIKAAEEGIGLGGDPVRALEYIMVAHEKMGNLDESRKVAQEILKKDPKNACARIQIMWLDKVKTPGK